MESALFCVSRYLPHCGAVRVSSVPQRGHQQLLMPVNYQISDPTIHISKRLPRSADCVGDHLAGNQVQPDVAGSAWLVSVSWASLNTVLFRLLRLWAVHAPAAAFASSKAACSLASVSWQREV